MSNLSTLNPTTTHEAHVLREVGPWNPGLQARYLTNPVARWCAQYLPGEDDRHPDCEMHLDIYDSCIADTKTVFMAPRSFAKTTKVRNYILFLVCEHEAIKAGKYPGIFPHNAVRYLSYAAKKAREVTGWVRDQLDNNPLILASYGDLKTDQWARDHFVTSNGVTVSSAGRGGQIRGFRPTLLICDDLDDDEEVRNDDRLLDAYYWWDTAVLGTIDEDEYQVFVIGTVLKETSLLCYIAAKPGWETKRYSAYVDSEFREGAELWPSKWPHDKLQRKLAEVGSRAFLQEYQNQPQPSANAIFERHWFRAYSEADAWFANEIGKAYYTIVSIDPATSRRDKTDYTALVTITALDTTPVKYLIRTEGVRQGHWVVSRAITKAVELHDNFYANALVIETVSFQEVYAQEVERYCDVHRRNITTHCVEPTTDKERRANAVAPIVERGQVYYDPSDAYHNMLINQCVLFEPGSVNQKKDLMDAFTQALTHMRAHADSERSDNSAGRVLPPGYEVNPVTGV